MNSIELNKKINYSLVILAHFLYHVVYYSLPIYIVYLRDDIFISYTQGGILWTVSLITTMFFSIAVGYYSDRSNVIRYLFIYGSVITILFSLFIVSLSKNYNMLLLAFFISGVGAAGYHPPAMSIITEMFESQKGKALSLNINIGMIGTAISPLIVSGSIHVLGSWKSSSQTLFLFGMTIIFCAILLNLIVGIYYPQKIEKNVELQLSYNKKLKISEFKFVLTLPILVPLIFVSIRGSFFKTASFFTAFLYKDYLHLTKDQASIATSLIIGFGSMFTIIGGAISDKFRPVTPILLSSFGTFISAVALVMIVGLANLPLFTIFYFILIASYYLASPATSALLADRVPAEKRGKLFGALFSFGQIFSMTTPAIFGYLKDSYGITSAFIFILVMAILVLILAIYIFVDEILSVPPQTDDYN